MLDLVWLVPALCLAGALGNLVLGVFRAPKALVSVLGVGSVAAATVVAWCALWDYLMQPLEVVVRPYFTWISAGGVTVDASLQVDPLSAVMVAFVTVVGLLIHVYSVGYMHGESNSGYGRYFAYLNLFMAAMLLLVLASNLPVLFIGWEGVGLCSYLLIGFYYRETWCAAAGSKAFIVNRIGDLGFLLAIFITIATFGSAEFTDVFPAAAAQPEVFAPAATVIALLLFVGAIGKSAQIPLYVWLPDAMAGPTPVSALIHAATMVTAGVYMVVRANVLFRLSPTAMVTVAVIGGATAIFAATIALVQNDIKKVLAYSTVSQLGYMFLATGAGAYIGAIFHVFTHAFFKACLFLGSGSVIHACGGDQDMRRMGGLKRTMPTTYWTFLAATLAISGIPVFAGFFSKDEILGQTFAAGAGNLNGAGDLYLGLWAAAVIAAILTAFYMFRALYLTFHGSFRGGEAAAHHIHESPTSMTFPLIVLGVLSTVGGFLGFPGQLFHVDGLNLMQRFLDPVILPLGPPVQAVATDTHAVAAHLSLGTEWLLVAASVAAAAAGLVVARSWYLGRRAFEIPQRLAARFPFIYSLLLNKYWVDELYDLAVVRPLIAVSRFCWRVIDELGIDAVLVNGSAFFVELTGDLLRFTTTGNVRHYALSLLAAIIGLAALLW